jgi:hypothetical protein
MGDEGSLDYLGRFLMRHLRDKAVDSIDHLLGAKWKAPRLASLQEGLSRLPPHDRDLVRRACLTVIDGAVHDFLFALVEEADLRDGRVALCVDGKNAVGMSDGLHGEQFGDRGWQARFSAHGTAPDKA